MKFLLRLGLRSIGRNRLRSFLKFATQAFAIGIVIGMSFAILGAFWPAWRVTQSEPRDILAGS